MGVVCLISCGGINLQAVIKLKIDGEIRKEHIVGVISNRENAFGLERAKQASIPTSVLSHESFENRVEFDHALIKLIDSYRPDLIVLAGFMRILTGHG